MREIHYATNNAYDTILLVAADGNVRGEWTVTPQVLAQFLADADPDNWQDQGLDGVPSDYGDTIAIRRGNETLDILDRERFAARCEQHGYECRTDGETTQIIIANVWADGDNWPIRYHPTVSPAEAAQEYVDDGDWGDQSMTSWIDVATWREGWEIDEDGETSEVQVDEETHTIEIQPEEPDCEADKHDWRAPFELLGGIEENPGCWGHGGGVIYREVCAHCGVYRVTDTWAQRRDTGEQGLRSIEYEPADEDSRAWVDRRKNQTTG